MNLINGGVCAAKGFTASGIHCGVRKNRTKKDLALIFSEVPASAAAVYTTNLVKGAPLTVTKQHIADGEGIRRRLAADLPAEGLFVFLGVRTVGVTGVEDEMLEIAVVIREHPIDLPVHEVLGDVAAVRAITAYTADGGDDTASRPLSMA